MTGTSSLGRPAARLLAVLAILATGAAMACDRGRSEDEYAAVSDTTRLVEDAGEVSLTEDGAIQGEVTSGMYRRWLAARQALLKAGVSLPSSAQLKSYGPAEVRRLVSRLEGNGRARDAISGAGMTVESFVITGVALERQLALATGPQRRALEESVAPGMPLDTMLPLPVPQPDPAPMPVPMPEPTDPRYPQPLPEPQPRPSQPLPAPMPVPVPVPAPQESTPARPVPAAPQTPTRIPTPAPSRPAPRDTVRLEPAPAPTKPDSSIPGSGDEPNVNTNP